MELVERISRIIKLLLTMWLQKKIIGTNGIGTQTS